MNDTPKANHDSPMWLTGYSGWSFYCAIISVLGITGYYSELFQEYLPTWVAVGIFVSPIVIILFVQWGEMPDRLVEGAHIVAASLIVIAAAGMEIGNLLGYKPDGFIFYRVLVHLGWTFAWAGILRRARARIPTGGKQDAADKGDRRG